MARHVSPPDSCAEDALLIRCARMFAGSESLERTSLLLPQVTNWPHVFNLASRHGTTPLISRLLLNTKWNALPEPCAKELQASSRDRAARSLRLTAELLKVLEIFEHNSIPAVAFKGPALAALLYGDITLREFCDLDILIRREDVRRVKEVLLERGYKTDLPAGPAQEAAYLRARHELHFISGDGCSIEIHQTFLAPFYCFPFDDEALWQRLEKKPFCGREILALAPEDLLLVLCAHATKHCWTRLAWICDMARLLVVAGAEIDFSRVMSRASSLGAARMVLLGLFLAHQVLGAPVPSGILNSAERDARALRLARKVEASIFNREKIAPSELESHRFFLQARERWREKFLYCTRLAFMPTEEDHSALSLPSLLSPMYYPLHAVRVFGKYGLASLKSFL